MVFVKISIQIRVNLILFHLRFIANFITLKYIYYFTIAFSSNLINGNGGGIYY